MSKKKERALKRQLRKKAIKEKEQEIKLAFKNIKVLEKELAALSKRKMRPGGGKPKGGAYERKIIKIIAKHFIKAGHKISISDCYRTKNSGGSNEKGDLQFSSEMCKLFNWCVECKFYKEFKFEQLLYHYDKMKKSWKFKAWWEQLTEEVKVSKKRGLLVFRWNKGIDLCAVERAQLTSEEYKQVAKLSKIEIKTAGGFIWVIRLDKFLKIVARR